MLMSATHWPELTGGLQISTLTVKMMLKDVVLSGTLKVTTPPVVPSALPATAPRLAEMKSSPGRVTRNEAALGMTDAWGKPAGRGVIPQLAQPLHPPPLHDAMTRTIRTKNAGRNDQRSMRPSTKTNACPYPRPGRRHPSCPRMRTAQPSSKRA